MQNCCGLHWTRQHSENTQGRPQQPCVTTGAKCKISRHGRTIPALRWLCTSFSFNTDSNYWELVSNGLGLWDRQVSHKSMVGEGFQVKGASDLEPTRLTYWRKKDWWWSSTNPCHAQPSWIYNMNFPFFFFLTSWHFNPLLLFLAA